MKLNTPPSDGIRSTQGQGALSPSHITITHFFPNITRCYTTPCLPFLYSRNEALCLINQVRSTATEAADHTIKCKPPILLCQVRRPTKSWFCESDQQKCYDIRQRYDYLYKIIWIGNVANCNNEAHYPIYL